MPNRGAPTIRPLRTPFPEIPTANDNPLPIRSHDINFGTKMWMPFIAPLLAFLPTQIPDSSAPPTAIHFLDFRLETYFREISADRLPLGMVAP